MKPWYVSRSCRRFDVWGTRFGGFCRFIPRESFIFSREGTLMQLYFSTRSTRMRYCVLPWDCNSPINLQSRDKNYRQTRTVQHYSLYDFYITETRSSNISHGGYRNWSDQWPKQWVQSGKRLNVIQDRGIEKLRILKWW